jgi:hypothetical protein
MTYLHLLYEIYGAIDQEAEFRAKFLLCFPALRRLRAIGARGFCARVLIAIPR